MKNEYVKCIKVNNDCGYWTLNKIYETIGKNKIKCDTDYIFHIPYYALQNADFIQVTQHEYFMQKNPIINSNNINKLITILKFINEKTI